MILDTYYYAGNIFKLDDIIDINSIDEIRVWNMHIISPYKIDFCKINNKNIKITFYKRSFEELNTLFLKQKKYKNKHRKLLIKIFKDYFWFKSNFFFNNEDNL